MSHWREYNDEASRAVFHRFKSALGPTLEEVAPNWLLHHIEMRRQSDWDTKEERVEIRLVIKPIGQARFAKDGKEKTLPLIARPDAPEAA